jgi:hypothetical protein
MFTTSIANGCARHRMPAPATPSCCRATAHSPMGRKLLLESDRAVVVCAGAPCTMTLWYWNLIANPTPALKSETNTSARRRAPSPLWHSSPSQPRRDDLACAEWRYLQFRHSLYVRRKAAGAGDFGPPPGRAAVDAADGGPCCGGGRLVRVPAARHLRFSSQHRNPERSCANAAHPLPQSAATDRLSNARSAGRHRPRCRSRGSAASAWSPTGAR